MLNQYKKEIIEIARANDVSEDVARDMFVANLEKGEEIEGLPWYGGADDFDYGEAHVEWLALSTGERAQAISNYKLG